MAKILVLSLLMALTAVSVSAQNASAPAIDCKSKRTNKELDAIFAKMYTFGNSGRNFPLNPSEATAYCKYWYFLHNILLNILTNFVLRETSDLIQRADVYVKNCLKEYPKQLFSVLIRTVKSQAKSLCGRPDSRRLQELFLSADCTNSAKNGYQKCINDSVDILIGVKSVEDSQKLQLMCWFVNLK